MAVATISLLFVYVISFVKTQDNELATTGLRLP